MPTIKDLLAGLKQGIGSGTRAEFHAAVNAVAAQVEAEIVDRDALIGKMGEALQPFAAVTVQIGNEVADDQALTTGGHFLAGDFRAAAAALAPDAITRAIEERRAIEAALARAVADEIRASLAATAGNVTGGKTAPDRTRRLLLGLDLDAPIQRALAAYRAQQGSK